MTLSSLNLLSHHGSVAVNSSLSRVRFKIYSVISICLLIHGCAKTTSVVPIKNSGPSEPVDISTIRDSGPSEPVDISVIPDAIPRDEPPSRRGNPKSYVVWGKRYYVMDDSRGFVQEGTASWYGKKFHGRKTSSGEVYDMYAMTAAHKSLPLPSYVQVKNLRNGRSVRVRVNDRGPFHGNRIIDLSYAAAAKLGIIKTGTGLVEVRVLNPVKLTRRKYEPTPARNDQLYVQIGAFSNRANADSLIHSVSHPELPSMRINIAQFKQVPVYRVQIGPIGSVGEAQRIIERLGQLGITSARLVSGT